MTHGQGALSAPSTGDVAAVGRPRAYRSRRRSLPPAAPQRLEVPSLGLTAPVVPRGPDGEGGIEAPPYEMAQAVGWFGAGAAPGADGAALLVGHADTDTRPAVFRAPAAVRPGAVVRVRRADGVLAEFTVDGVDVLPRRGFDAHRAHGRRDPGRAELRLITCGGAFDPASGSYAADVVVSAYLTGVR
ncbi:sortase [Streptomyces sp. CC77]|uniref:sortase domain-containing protein n=1 Tax=Streptomyces sp. CC77 TaxID=1906739 RepID=UPI0034A46369